MRREILTAVVYLAVATCVFMTARWVWEGKL